MNWSANRWWPEQSKASITAPAAARARRAWRRAVVAAGRAVERPPRPRTTDFEYTKDWTVNAGGRGAPPLEALDVTGNLVFAGNGYVINKTKVNPYEGLDVKGKIIVVAGLPAELAAQQAAAGRRPGRTRWRGRHCGARRRPTLLPPRANGPGGPPPNPLGEACTDFLTPEQYAAKNGALAVVTIANFQQLSTMANPNAAAGFGGFGGGGGTRRTQRTQLPGPQTPTPAGLPVVSRRSPPVWP